MEFEQFIKRLDWLDEERRKDKTTIATLEERMKGLESDLKAAHKKIKEVNAGISKASVTPARLDQLEASQSVLRNEVIKYVDALDEKQREVQQASEERLQFQIENVVKSIAELRKVKSSTSEIRREVKLLADEETRRNKNMAEWEVRVGEMMKTSEAVQRAQHVVEESRKLEMKRLADLQGDLSAARKRLEETREKHDVFADGLRRVETRINDLLSSELERKQTQVAFVESHNRVQVERDRAWKEWEGGLETFRKNAEAMDKRLQEWEVAQRAVKRAQDTYEDLIQKFERRINEISEMQRLAEDRFRQEWVTFKADDQKRWTSFNLTQDEVRKDLRGEMEKLRKDFTALADQSQTQQDVIEQTQDANEQLFQGMLSQIHELLASYERIMSTR